MDGGAYVFHLCHVSSYPFRPRLGTVRGAKVYDRGHIEAQGVNAVKEIPKKPYTGRLDAGLADEFRKRTATKIASIHAEIEAMNTEHAELIAKFKVNSLIKHGEQELRAAVEETGPEFWRLEGRYEETEEGPVPAKWSLKHNKTIEDIVTSVEASLDRKAHVVHPVSRVQSGGYQEPAPEPIPEPPATTTEAPAPPAALAEPLAASTAASMSRQTSQAESQNSGIMVGDSDIDMGGTAAGLLDQMHTGFSSTSTPLNSFPTPQPQLSAMASSVATPVQVSAASPQVAPPTIPEEAMEDVASGSANAQDAAGTRTTPDQGTGSGDWVVIPQGGVSPNPSATGTNTQPPPVSGEARPAVAAVPASGPGSAAPTPAGQAVDSESMAFEVDNNDFSSLGDLDTAGDALANYDPPGGDLGDALDLHMTMDDSAFGDAFHGMQGSREEDGDGLGL